MSWKRKEITQHVNTSLPGIQFRAQLMLRLCTSDKNRQHLKRFHKWISKENTQQNKQAVMVTMSLTVLLTFMLSAKPLAPCSCA